MCKKPLQYNINKKNHGLILSMPSQNNFVIHINGGPELHWHWSFDRALGQFLGASSSSRHAQ